MGLEGGLTGAKPIKLNGPDKGGAGGGAGGGTRSNNLLLTMNAMQRGEAPAGGTTPEGTVLFKSSFEDLQRATALVKKHDIQGSAGQQLRELARRVKAGEIDWNEALED